MLEERTTSIIVQTSALIVLRVVHFDFESPQTRLYTDSLLWLQGVVAIWMITWPKS